MSAWIRLRRLCASAMLVAMMAFVAHGIAVSHGHDHGSVPAGPPEHRHLATTPDGARATAAAWHHHHGGHVHVAPADLDEAGARSGEPGTGHHADGSGTPCCGQACVTAIQVSAPAVLVAPVSHRVRLASHSQSGSGIEPHGLKRPPRTPDIG